MARKPIPKSIREKILREFNHRCAICGNENPHIHHIDSNPSNNAEENLLPLCPNCHLIDQHDPTRALDPIKLKLFRQHKDPSILSPKFEPLFRRFVGLLNLDESSFETDKYSNQMKELVSFVSVLEMGSFYSNQLGALLAKPPYTRAYSSDTPQWQHNEWDRQERKGYFDKLNTNKEKAISLIIELLRYQNWSVNSE